MHYSKNAEMKKTNDSTKTTNQEKHRFNNVPIT